MRMTVDLADAKPIGGSVPKNWYTCITSQPDGRSAPDWIEYSQKMPPGATQGAPMFVTTLVVDEENEHKGRHIFPPHRVLLGGLKENGERHNLNNCCQFINATRITWTCMECGFVGGSGVELGYDSKLRNYFCPNCKKQPKLDYETNDFQNKRIRVLVSEVKGLNTDEMVNRVDRVAPLS